MSAGRRALAALAALAVAAASATVAWAAGFGGSVAAPATLSAYAVPAPAGIACRGLSSLLSSRIVWNPVTPPAGETVAYVVTAPGGRATTTATASYDLPAITLLPGQYAVEARISSGWRSPPATITVSLTALGLLYLCNTP